MTADFIRDVGDRGGRASACDGILEVDEAVAGVGSAAVEISKAISTASGRGADFGASFEKTNQASTPCTSTDPASAQRMRTLGRRRPNACTCAAARSKRHF